MMKLFTEYRFFTSLAVLLLFPILALTTLSKSHEDYNLLDRIVTTLATPLQRAIYGTMDFGAHGLENYIFVLETKKAFADLEEQSRKMMNQLAELKEVELENHRLHNLFQLQNSLTEKKILARVIAQDVLQEFRSLRIDRGSDDGVQKGYAVLTHEGIVGRILRVGSHVSEVITIMDNLSAVDAMIQRSRARGLLEGQTDETCALKYVLRADDVAVGDQVLTSGLDGLFPKGISLGTVYQVTKKSFGITQDVIIKPAVDFSKLEEVLVVSNEHTSKAIHTPLPSETEGQ